MENIHTLNDPEKRKRYDNHGIVDDQDRRGSHPESHFRHHYRSFHSPFDSFFDDDFFGGGHGRKGEHFLSSVLELPLLVFGFVVLSPA